MAQDEGRTDPSAATPGNAPADPPAPPPAQDRQRLLAGRYRLEGLLGRGSMGAVWRAHDTVLRRAVAVKEVILPPTQTEEDHEIARERALREARAIAALSHPNVVTLYDVVDEDGRPWVVMELVPAPSLAEILRDKGPLAPPEAARIGLAVLGALDAAHQVGITHRDVKPGNILVSPDGRVKLADFGISRKVDESQLTRTGLMVGSPSYIAPEVARGKEAGRPADIWGLGATLHCAVEGTPPFDLGDPVATLTAVVGEPPRPAPHAGPLGPVIARTLVKDPRQRIQTEDLRKALADVASRTGSATSTLPVAGPLPTRTVQQAVRQAGPPGPPRPPVPTGPGATSTGMRPPSGSVNAPPVRGPVTAPPSRGPVTGAPRAAMTPPPASPARRPSTWIAVGVAILLIIGAVVAVVLASGDDNGGGGAGLGSGSATPTTSASVSSSGAPSSSSSAPSGPTGSAEAIAPSLKGGTVSAGIEIADRGWFGFGLQIPQFWAIAQPNSGRVELVPASQKNRPRTQQTRMTVIAEVLTAESVDAQLQAQQGEKGSPAALPDYEQVDREVQDGGAVYWEYTFTASDGTATRGITWAIEHEGVLWRVLFAAPQTQAGGLDNLAEDVIPTLDWP